MGNSSLYDSPDGILVLIVEEDQDDFTIGFLGYPWHTHGAVLVSEYMLRGDPADSPKAAAERFVTEIMKGNVVIAVASVGGKIQDIWPTYDPGGELKYKPDQEQIEFRYWDGTPWPSP